MKKNARQNDIWRAIVIVFGLFVALTNFAHRNPPGMNFVHAACDLLQLGLSILF